jgi:hypothetical protein
MWLSGQIEGRQQKPWISFIPTNAPRFDDIYAITSLEYRRASTEGFDRKLPTGVKKKLGEAGQWSLGTWAFHVVPSGSIVNMRCKTKFTQGDAH